MHVQLVARQPSAHHLFRFKPEAPPHRVQSRTKNHLDRHFDHSGPSRIAYQTYGRVGMLIGILESLNGMPVDGNVTVSVSSGTYEMTGNLSVFNVAAQPAVQEALMAADRVARDLAFDQFLKNLDLTYTQEIVEIGGNCR